MTIFFRLMPKSLAGNSHPREKGNPNELELPATYLKQIAPPVQSTKIDPDLKLKPK